MKAVILAGGAGTRLRGVTGDLAKPLVPVGGRPVLEHQIDNLRRHGITDILLVIGHRGADIRHHCGDGTRFGVRITYFDETRPLGTAGALGLLRDRLPEELLVLYGDLILDMDLDRLLAHHRASGAHCTLVVHPNNHPHDSDLLTVDGAGRVRGLLRKNVPREGWHANCVNAGVFVLRREVLDRLRPGEPADLERDLVEPAIRDAVVYAYRTSEYIRDMGTPERYRQVDDDMTRAVVPGRNLSRPQRAIFVDRDGTINEHVGYVSRPDDLTVPDQACAALELVNRSGFLAIVITNQPVVARNMCTEDGLREVHDKLETVLGWHGAYVDDIFYCPHHPDSGYPGENLLLKVPCDCRKPGTALIDEAAARYHIDLSSSYLVGDATTDVQTARAAGLRSVLVGTGEAGRDGRYPVDPDLRARDLWEAVTLILSEAGSAPAPLTRVERMPA